MRKTKTPVKLDGSKKNTWLYRVFCENIVQIDWKMEIVLCYNEQKV
mgnify:CR=1 FL=1